MLERFTRNARAIVVGAQQAALRAHAPEVRPAHLLESLVSTDSVLAMKVLAELGAPGDEVRRVVRGLATQYSDGLDADDAEMTRTRKVRRRFVAEKYASVIEAFYNGASSADVTMEITFEDGEELLDYLYHRGSKYTAPGSSPTPGLILLDLNMPRKDGREALREIKSDPDLRRIPVVVLTTSKAEEDIYRTYDLGANSFITKPVSFEGLVAVMRDIGRYWIEIVELPPDHID